MNILKKFYCRAFQRALYVAYPFLPYREPILIEELTGGIPGVLKKEKKNHPLIVTDQGIVAAGLIKPLISILENSNVTYSLYSDVIANPTSETVQKGLDKYINESCDSLIAIGGGSSMDTAKAIGARIARKHKPLAKMKGILKVIKRIPLLIAIPTTAGTGSETTLAAVIVDAKSREKYAISDFPLIPRYALLDPTYTLTLPKGLTATTGMDALTHAVEAYIGKSSFKMTRIEAKVAVRLIFQNIENAYNDGENYKARANMLRAAYLAGCAFTRSYVGYVHALAHALGGKYNTPHGLANAVLLPYVLEAYGDSINKKLKKLSIAVGLADELTDEKVAATTFIEAIKELNKKLNIPRKLKIYEEDISSLANHAEKEANPLYPVPVLWTRKELESLYNKVKE